MISAIITILNSIFEKYIVEVLRARVDLFADRNIKITTPRAHETLPPSGQIGANPMYLVRGKIRKLPKGHALWLIIEIRGQKAKQFWPQGFKSVQFDESTGEWFGYVTVVPGKGDTKVIAVVAPPTTQDFFDYFQTQGSRTDYAPLGRLPPECTNKAEVQANFL